MSGLADDGIGVTRLPCDAPPPPTTRYPRVEFREFDPDAEPFRPSWETAVPAVNATLNEWLKRLDKGPFAEVVEDENGRRWQLSAHAEDGALQWRVEMAGYQWFMSATAGRPQADRTAYPRPVEHRDLDAPRGVTDRSWPR